jgi:hypothetical protein
MGSVRHSGIPTTLAPRSPVDTALLIRAMGRDKGTLRPHLLHHRSKRASANVDSGGKALREGFSRGRGGRKAEPVRSMRDSHGRGELDVTRSGPNDIDDPVCDLVDGHQGGVEREDASEKWRLRLDLVLGNAVPDRQDEILASRHLLAEESV